MTGGSSGGSAAAVASGVVPWALGSDTGGSIRIPSSFCGTVGLKPTTGRIPIGGMLPLAPSMDTPGPIAGTVEDAGTLWRVLAGLPSKAARAPDQRDLAGAAARVGIVGGYYAELVHPDVQSGVAAAAAALAAAGATLTDVDGHGIEDARRIWNTICSAEFVEAHPALRGRWDEVLDPSIREEATEADALAPEVRSTAAVRRKEISRWFHDRLVGLDALLVPTTGYPAQAFEATTLPAGPAGPIDLTRVRPGWFTCPANLSGLPAISVPAGRSADGLPFGVTLIGHDDAEETLLSLAAII
jgi:aspartyl-tRNA(Asn)/glutamyl-tRNA(Gln) amidotransferase subunit A